MGFIDSICIGFVRRFNIAAAIFVARTDNYINNKDKYHFYKVWGAGKKYSYAGKEEIRCIGKYIKDGSLILDIGCGSGRSSINFYRKLKLSNCKFIFADFFSEKWKENINNIRQEISKKSDFSWLFHKDNTGYFTASDRLLIENCRDNGLTCFEIVGLDDAVRMKKLSGIDIVYSFHSVGYHFPIEDNLNKYNLLGVTSDDALFIFGVNNWSSNNNVQDHIKGLKLIDRVKGNHMQDFLVFKKA